MAPPSHTELVPGPWVRQAACAGTYPDHDARLPSERADAEKFRARVEAAKERCARCPVLTECQAWAAALPRFCRSGVIGGKYYKDRIPGQILAPKRHVS